MFRSSQRSSVCLLVLSALLFLPSTVFAQAAITGVARDTSGGVLPGVTVEAASPVLIEKVRSAVTDDTGQYRIVDLRPGTYSVTFTLPGFSTVRREGIELTGTFVATVNGDLKVGALEETITVTGETPIVDVQSARVQQTVSKDILAAIPSSRNAARHPGADSRDELRTAITAASTATQSGGAGTIHGGRGNDSRTQSDGNNTGWAGGSAGGGNTPNVAGAQEVVRQHVRRPRRSGDGRRHPERHPARRQQQLQRPGQLLRREQRDAGQQLHAGAEGSRASRAPSELLNVYDINPMGGGRIVRDKLWFYLTYRQTGGERTVPGMWFNKNAGNPNAWTVDFDRDRPAFNDNLDRNGIARITWQITPRNKFSMHWSELYTTSSTKGGGSATTTPEASGRTALPAVADSARPAGRRR